MTTIVITRETGTHKPLDGGSNPAAASFTFKVPQRDQGITRNPQAYPHVNSEQGIPYRFNFHSYSCIQQAYRSIIIVIS